MSYKAKVALILAIFLWASAFVGIREGLHDYSPAGLALLRYLIASFSMLIIYSRLPKRNAMRFIDMIALLLIGALGIGVYNITLNYGELSFSSGMSSFIISQSPIITASIAIIFLGEELNLTRAIGFIVSIFGVALIAISEKAGFTWNLGLLYILIATLASGLYSILQKPFLKKYHAIEATTYIIWGGTLFLSLYFSQLQHDIAHASLKTTLTIIYLGIFPAALGYLAWGYVLTEIPASQAVSFLYFMPFLATILGWVFLGEIPMWLSLFGGTLAIVGVWIVNSSPIRKKL